MNFGTIILYQSMEAEQNYAIQILIALLFTLRASAAKNQKMWDHEGSGNH